MSPPPVPLPRLHPFPLPRTFVIDTVPYLLVFTLPYIPFLLRSVLPLARSAVVPVRPYARHVLSACASGRRNIVATFAILLLPPLISWSDPSSPFPNPTPLQTSAPSLGRGSRVEGDTRSTTQQCKSNVSGDPDSFPYPTGLDRDPGTSPSSYSTICGRFRPRHPGGRLPPTPMGSSDPRCWPAGTRLRSSRP